jgi:HK97 family phage prohead protease
MTNIEIDIKELKHIPFTIRGNTKIISKGNDRVIAGYANVAVVDDENDFIPLEVLQEGIDSLIKNPEFANLMLYHQNIQIGQILESYGKFKTHVDDKGLFVVCKLREDLEIANNIWEDILNNAYRGFSIGCEVIQDHKECDEKKCVTVLDKINIFEVSVCDHPTNNTSGFVVISKSKLKGDECVNDKEIDMAKDKKKADDQDTKIEDTKTEETKTESTDETKTEDTKTDDSPKDETKTESEQTLDYEAIQDRLNKMEAKMNSLEALLQKSLKKDEDEDEDEKKEDKGCSCEDEDTKTEEKPPEDTKTEESPKNDDTISSKLDQIVDLLNNLNKARDLEQELKARDDKLNSLETKIKSLTKPEEKTKETKKEETKTEETKTEESTEKETPKTLQDTDNIPLIKDSKFVYSKGQFYKKLS